jgi:thioredoxin reductase
MLGLLGVQVSRSFLIVAPLCRRDAFRASKIMQKRVFDNPKIEVLWNSVVEEAYGNARGLLGGVKVGGTDLRISARIWCGFADQCAYMVLPSW